jgi:hypothetical protein
MATALTCSNCQAMLVKQWFDHGLRAYDCRVCGYLTGPEGQALGPRPKQTLRSRGLLFIAVAIGVLALLLIAYPQLAEF